MNHNQLEDQEALIAHLSDPETLKRAAEGSMEKRQELIDRVDNKPKDVKQNPTSLNIDTTNVKENK